MLNQKSRAVLIVAGFHVIPYILQILFSEYVTGCAYESAFWNFWLFLKINNLQAAVQGNNTKLFRFFKAFHIIKCNSNAFFFIKKINKPFCIKEKKIVSRYDKYVIIYVFAFNGKSQIS